LYQTNITTILPYQHQTQTIRYSQGFEPSYLYSYEWKNSLHRMIFSHSSQRQNKRSTYNTTTTKKHKIIRKYCTDGCGL